MSSPIDTNVDHYTIPELVTILGLADDSGDFEKACDLYIDKFENDGNTRMSHFFRDIKARLLDYVTTTDDNQEKGTAEQTQEWFENEVLEPANPVEKNKTTERKDTAELYKGGDHDPMNKKQLGVNNIHDVPVIQDVLNPNLKNVTERLLNIDSQYRQTGTASTDYTMDLSDHLNDTLSMRLFSFQIPVTWYVIDEAYANNSFWVTDGSNNRLLIAIDSGNYTPASLVAALTKSIKVTANITKPTDPSWTPVSYNDNNGKITLDFAGSHTPTPGFAITQLLFYDPTSPLVNNFIDQTLGWILGFQLPYLPVQGGGGNQGTAVLDLNGTKYFLLVIDDYNQNRINNGLVGITELSRNLRLPSYFSTDLPMVIVQPNAAAAMSQLQANQASLTPGQRQSDNNPGELLMEKSDITYTAYPQLLPSAPRTLTQSQIYTINQILKNNDKNTNYRTKAPTNTDVLAVIPIKGGQKFGSMYMELSGSLQTFKRTYFGPVNIDRLHISLLDDKGNVVNLNGCEWSVMLVVENLYQY